MRRRTPPDDEVEVAVVSWPNEAERLAALRAHGEPRLVLVPEGLASPVGDDELEDWVRLPATDDEVTTRRRRLARLAREVGAHGPFPAPAGSRTLSSPVASEDRRAVRVP